MPAAGQRLDVLLAAPVEHPDRHRVAAHRLDDGAIGFRLGVLVRHRFAVHEQELGAQQADAVRARLGDQRQLDRQFQVGLEFHRFAVGGFRRQPAQLGIALALPREGGDRPPRRRQSRCAGVQHHGAGGAIDHGDVARLDGMRQSDGAQHGRHAERAQHDGGVVLRAAFLGRDAGKPGRIQQRRVGRSQRLADQHRAFRQSGEALERRAGQVAHQPPPDLAHLLGAPRQAGAVIGRHVGFNLGQDCRGDRVGFFHHRGFRRYQGLLDPLLDTTQQPRWPEHADVGVDQRCDLFLALLRQHGQPSAQLGQLLA